MPRLQAIEMDDEYYNANNDVPQFRPRIILTENVPAVRNASNFRYCKAM